jgi:hypothetical protein
MVHPISCALYSGMAANIDAIGAVKVFFGLSPMSFLLPNSITAVAAIAVAAATVL